MEAIDHGDELPEPDDGMTPEQKGALLLRYVLAERSVARMNFRSTRLRGSDLVGARLSRADLSGADLSEAVLVDADLRLTKLDGANLQRANLMVACLDRTSFEGADLTDAVLCGADLTRARFAGAKLRRCDMTLVDTFGADFTRTDLCGTHWGESRIANVDLKSARLLGAGLWAPCSVGVEVLARTYAAAGDYDLEGVERFFRCCGVPDDLLTYYREHGARVVPVTDTGLHERLDHLRELLKNQVTNHADVREMLLDKGAAHILAKDRKLIQTGLQRIAGGVMAEVQRRTLGKLGDVIRDEFNDDPAKPKRSDGEEESSGGEGGG